MQRFRPVWIMAGIIIAVAPVGLCAQQPARILDTLYALATDSAKVGDHPWVYVLDDGVIRLEADGRASRTYRQVIWVLEEGAVEQWSEFQYGYEPGRQKLTVNWARVVTPEGEVLTPEPDISQEADVPASMGTPMYVDQKILRFTLGRVRVGTLVDVSYTLDDLKPWRSGDFYATWVVNPGLPVLRSRLLLDTPTGMTPRVMEENLDFEPKVEERDGRRVTTWAPQNVASFELEPFAADSNGVVMRIDVAGQSSWADIGGWYAGLAKDRYTLSPAVEQKLGELVAGAKTIDDSLRAVHRFVSDDIRYVAVELGIGGYQPRAAAEVLSSGFGDCKDKATLFIAMLRRMGVTAHPVLLNNGGSVERRLPSVAQFNHAIAAVERPNGRVFVDLTASQMRGGDLPGSVQGQFALVVEGEGRTLEVETPEGSDMVSRVTVQGTLDTAGFATARVGMDVSGDLATTFRQLLAHSPDSADLAQMARGMATTVFPEALGDSISITDLGERVRVGFLVRGGRAAQLAGPVVILSIPFEGQAASVDFTPLIAELESRKPRRFPIDIGQVSSASSGELVYEMELPAGWRVQPVPDVSLSSAFGEVGRTVGQEGARLRLHQRHSGKRGVLPPERVGELVSWLRQLGGALRSGRNVVLTRSGG